MHDEFYSLTGKLKNISNSLYGFSSVGDGVATRRLPCLRYGSHYLEVEICHRWTLLSANPKFSGWKKLWKSAKTSKTHPLPPPGLACVMQDLKLLSFNVQWFRVFGAPFSSFGCFIFEIWVLRASVLVVEWFVFEATSNFMVICIKGFVWNLKICLRSL